MNFTKIGLLKEGFVGFYNINSFFNGRADIKIPGNPGNYIVFRIEKSKPTFLEKSPAGWFKGIDPTVGIEKLGGKWVEGANVLYIGQTGYTEGKKGTLKYRIQTFIKFGSGKDVGHWGGRLIWQVKGHENFLIAWRIIENNENPLIKEKQMRKEFKDIYGKIPFANLIE